jgi:hypothetical protein
MRNYIIILLMVLMALPILAKDWNQYYFKFQIKDKSELNTLTRIISIDNVKGNEVWAYANDDEWAAFQALGYSAELLPAPGSLYEAVMSDTPVRTVPITAYPTYTAYVDQMYAYAASYPNLCQIVDAGTTVNGRKILFAKISDNIATHEAEPEVMYTSTMHGDETVGYILMLDLIEYLLSNYATDTRVQNMVNNLEIWINPNANPDGTYYGGNSTVTYARRYNANGIDLNRSFPDVWGGATQTHQIENTIMENIANAHHFVLSANFHGGAEVFNYPWDGSYSLHVENDWFISLGISYLNSVHAVSPSTYMDDLYSGSIPGLTNGAAWYIVYGGRQDWMNYNKQCKEVTVELSSTKNPAASTLANYWNYNRDALLGYLENALFGLQGLVTDGYGNPLAATINVVGLDDANSKSTTDPAHGDYIKMLLPGTYTVQFSAAGYPTQTFENVVITANQKTTLNVVMGDAVQNIPLTAGWNLISLNRLPANPAVASVFSSISAQLLQVKNDDVTYAPAVSSWFNTMDAVQTGKGYWVKVSSDCTLSVMGTGIDPVTSSIDLNPGWNLVAYYPATALAPAVALASISSSLQEVKSATQSYVPGGSGNTLTQMAPGKGYWIKVSQACTLTYPGSIR